jgi:tetratricopeptide (TPR) repeat protein
MLRSTRGDLEGGVALGRRNCELTEQLGDVFSRSLAIANLAVTENAMGDHESALESIEEAERLYRGAMGDGGEMETWRGGIRAEALLGVGRAEEAVEAARAASEVAKERGMLWSLPLALLALARAAAATGDADAARRALDEGAAIAKRTGATVNLEDIEAERDLLPAGSR